MKTHRRIFIPDYTASHSKNTVILKKNYRTNLFFFGNLNLVSVSRDSPAGHRHILQQMQ